jgi:hypothetical protein
MGRVLKETVRLVEAAGQRVIALQADVRERTELAAARYITGMQLRVDAGGYLKWYDYHI